MQTGLVIYLRNRLERISYRIFVRTYPLEDVGQNRAGVTLGAPVRAGEELPAVRDVDRDVTRPILAAAGDLDAVSGDLGTKFRRLLERQRGRAAAARIRDVA